MKVDNKTLFTFLAMLQFICVGILEVNYHAPKGTWLEKVTS